MVDLDRAERHPPTSFVRKIWHQLTAVAGRVPTWAAPVTALVLLAVMLVPIALPYVQEGFQLGHDRHVPYLRVLALEDALASGQFPPRWFAQFDGGYGSPYPSFYGMLFYYLAAIFHVVGLSLGSAVELTAFLTMAGSGLAMFLLVGHLWGPAAGLLSAALYVYAPYLLVDAFVRGAYRELTSLCLVSAHPAGDAAVSRDLEPALAHDW